MSGDSEILLGKFRSGDKEAFAALFKSYYPKLIFFANRFVNNVDTSEEITGEVFVVLWEKREELTITTSVSAYLYAMTRNRCINYLKHQKIESLYLSYLQNNNLLDSCADDTEACYNDKELALQIKAAIDTLPEKCRQVFMMSRYEEMKYRDIAVKLGISSKTVERHMSIALERLRKMLKYVAYLF